MTAPEVESVIVTWIVELKDLLAGLITGVAACVEPFSNPKTLTCDSDPVYTLPLIAVGTMNLTEFPGLSRVQFGSLVAWPLEYSNFERSVASCANRISRPCEA